MFEIVAIWCVAITLLLTLVAVVMELRRLGDLAEAINNAIERIAVAAKKR